MQKLSIEKLHRIRNIYKNDRFGFYGLGVLSFIAGVKLCDLIFYDEQKLLRAREEIEENYWKTYGEPKHLQP